jgi:hypothetical protein
MHEPLDLELGSKEAPKRLHIEAIPETAGGDAIARLDVTGGSGDLTLEDCQRLAAWLDDQAKKTTTSRHGSGLGPIVGGGEPGPRRRGDFDVPDVP